MDQNSPSLINKTRQPKRPEWLVAILVGLIVGGYVGGRYFIVETRHIVAGSMEPTLRINDMVTIDKISYRFNQPQRSDIILFSPTDNLKKEGYSEDFIKRVIGLPGDKVEVKDDQVFINGQLLAEEYSSTKQIAKMTEIYIEKNKSDPKFRLWTPEATGPTYQGVVPEQQYFVLGDHRSASFDSRSWGFVPQNKIIGKFAFHLNSAH
jgi:signal peptidase I